MNFLEEIFKKEPKFDKNYTSFIDTYTVKRGGKIGSVSEKDRANEGRLFSYKYEIYMYACFIGLKYDCYIPLDNNGEKFRNIENWKPNTIRDYLIMSILAKGDYDLFDLESLNEKELLIKINEIVKDIESYANGGFDVLFSKTQDDPDYFVEDEFAFVELLNE